MTALALVMSTPMAANTVMVVGSATTWPTACSRCERPKRVKSGMLSDSVGQKPIIAVSDGMNTGENDARVGNLRGALMIVPRAGGRQGGQPATDAAINRA